jgi:hypothetical protein
MTISAWVDYNYVPSTGISGIIVWKSTTASDFNPQYDSGDIGAAGTGSNYRYWWTKGGTRSYSPAIPVNSVAWTYIVLTYDGTTFKPYINGVYQSAGATSAAGPLDSSAGKALYIGMRTASGYAPFNGYISNVQIYNISLSANEIQTLYIGGIGGPPLLLQNLVGWWPLNGDANDYSGNNNNGAPFNVVYSSSWYSGYTQT